MEFFDKLGKKASEAYKMTADKTGKIAKETKMKLKMNELKSQVSDFYEEIGKRVYEKHVEEEENVIDSDIKEICTKIDVLSDEIETILQECLELKDQKQCPNCHSKIDKDDKFCHECGEKQNDEPAKEVEVVEDLEKAEVKEENETEKNIIQEKLQQEITDENKQENKQDNKNEENCQSSKLEKTVEVEIDPKIEPGENQEYIEMEASDEVEDE